MNSFLYPQWFSIPESGALLFLKSNILSTQYALLSWKTNVHEFCSIFSLTITSHSDFLECILIDCSIFWIYNTFKKNFLILISFMCSPLFLIFMELLMMMMVKIVLKPFFFDKLQTYTENE